MKTEEYVTYWNTEPGMRGDYALLCLGGGTEVVMLDDQETHHVLFFKSHTDKVWYSGTAGSALANLQKAFYRMGVPELGILNYAMVRRADDGLETVAEFDQPLKETVPDDKETRNRRDSVMKYQVAWQHRCTGDLWKNPKYKTRYGKYPEEITGWMRQRCDLVKSYKAAVAARLDVPSAKELQTEWIQIRKTVRTGVVVEMGPVLKISSGQAESVIAIPPEIHEAYVALRRAGKTNEELLILWGVRV